MTKEKQIKITQIKSIIGRSKRQIATLKGLGLGRIGKSKTITLNPPIEGMIKKVDFLLKIEEVI